MRCWFRLRHCQRGLVADANAGNRLGAIRVAKGKSVAAVFQEFSSAQKAEIQKAEMRRKSRTRVVPNGSLALIFSIDRYCALALKVLGVAFT